MRTAQLADMKRLAELDAPFCKLVKASTEIGVVFPSRLKQNLEQAGFKIEVSKRTSLTEVLVLNKASEIVARAQSIDENDALVLAVYRKMEEEETEAGQTKS